jgi:nitrogen-specific signal transduction histidine kinase/ActR/RegA family two-component response regulator
VREAGGRVTSIAGIATDVTDRRRLEQELLQAQKLESVGRLAGGVAHDFNNLFTIILSRVALMLAEAPGGAFAQELRDVRQAAERAASLTRQLLTFARRQVMAPQVIELNEALAGMQESVRALAGEGVAAQFLRGGSPVNVRVDPDALQQIVLNLAANAVDAMPDGGVIAMAVHPDESLPFDADDEGRRQGVCLEISDTGTGIPADVMPHIFEPFYTTKSREHGTGLGLAAVHGLVRQAGGEIRVTSEHGIGTRFTIWLPVVESGVPAADPARVRGLLEAVAATREATVLVVEDEPAVHSIACRVLASAGYRVLEASDGHAAIDLALSHKGRIDLLLSDVIMPHMGGHELASRFRTLRPETRVLLTSGYTQDWSFVGIADVDAPAFLTKPYAPTALLEKVRNVIGEAVSQV